MALQKKNISNMLYFTVAEKNFQLPVSEVEGIITLPLSALSPVPFCDNTLIAGLFTFRGNIFALAGSDCFMSVKNKKNELTVILLNIPGKRLGISVDSVNEVSAENSSCITLSAQNIYEKKGVYTNEAE